MLLQAARRWRVTTLVLVLLAAPAAAAQAHEAGAGETQSTDSAASSSGGEQGGSDGAAALQRERRVDNGHREALAAAHAAQRAHRGLPAALVRRKRLNMGDRQRKGAPGHAEALHAHRRSEPMRRFHRQQSPPPRPSLPRAPPEIPQPPAAPRRWDTQSAGVEEQAETTAAAAEEEEEEEEGGTDAGEVLWPVAPNATQPQKCFMEDDLAFTFRETWALPEGSSWWRLDRFISPYDARDVFEDAFNMAHTRGWCAGHADVEAAFVVTMEQGRVRLYVPGRHHTGDWARNGKFMRRRIITLHQLLHDVARLRRCGEDRLLRGSFLLCIADGLHSPMDEVGWDGASSNATATRPIGADPAQRAVAPVVITSSSVSTTSMPPSAVLHHGIPFPDRDNLHTLLRKRIAAASHAGDPVATTSPTTDWQQRRAAACWRGASTGLPRPMTGVSWQRNQRVMLTNLSVTLARLADPPWLDARLVNLAQSDAEVAAVLRRMGLLGNHWTHADMTRCRYVLDVDGNVNSWGYFWKLQSNAVIFKVESAFGFTQWFYERLEPWVHYIPVAADLSDLRRHFEWAEAHPAEVQLMVRRANAAMAAITYDTEVQWAFLVLEGIFRQFRGPVVGGGSTRLPLARVQVACLQQIPVLARAPSAVADRYPVGWVCSCSKCGAHTVATRGRGRFSRSAQLTAARRNRRQREAHPLRHTPPPAEGLEYTGARLEREEVESRETWGVGATDLRRAR